MMACALAHPAQQNWLAAPPGRESGRESGKGALQWVQTARCAPARVVGRNRVTVAVT